MLKSTSVSKVSYLILISYIPYILLGTDPQIQEVSKYHEKSEIIITELKKFEQALRCHTSKEA